MSDIEEIKQRLDIVEVISGYLPLQKSGHNFKAICPFHAEKTPSFYVFPARQSWHCFGGCGTGGDIFAFIMKKENVDFGEALRMLAQKAGVALEKRGSEGRGDKEQRKRLLEMNVMSADRYHELLLQAPEANASRAYLSRRGLSQEAIKDFQLGFSSGSRNGLHQYLVGIGCQEKDLVSAGLVGKTESGSTYDRFRNRLMFPIRDARGEVLGFGARALDDSHPKYLNSPQTILFDKGSILYGLDRAKEAITKQDMVVIVEGYMDVIAAHQYGFNNVVASMGTSLTEKQVSSLKKLTKNIVFALDADTAGAMATLRGIKVTAQAFAEAETVTWGVVNILKYENLLETEFKVIVLPQGKDPDDIIRQNPEDWLRQVQEAVPVVDYALMGVASKFDLTKPADKSEVVNQMQPLIEQIKDPIRRAHYIQKLAHLVGVDEHLLAEALRTTGKSTTRSRTKDRSQTSIILPSRDSWEEYTLSLLFHCPELRECMNELLPDYFECIENRGLFLAWQESASPELLHEEMDDTIKERFVALSAKLFPPMTAQESQRAMDDCVRRLRTRWLTGLKGKEEEVFFSETQNSSAPAAPRQLGHAVRAVEINDELKNAFKRQSSNAGRRIV